MGHQTADNRHLESVTEAGGRNEALNSGAGRNESWCSVTLSHSPDPTFRKKNKNIFNGTLSIPHVTSSFLSGI